MNLTARSLLGEATRRSVLLSFDLREESRVARVTKREIELLGYGRCTLEINKKRFTLKSTLLHTTPPSSPKSKEETS